MSVRLHQTELRRMIRETLGLDREEGSAEAADEKPEGSPIVVNEPPLVPIRPEPSVSGVEVGSIRQVAAFESTPTMKKLGKLLSGLSSEQQGKVYKQIKLAVGKKNESKNTLSSLIQRLIEGPGVNPRPGDPDWEPSSTDWSKIKLGSHAPRSSDDPTSTWGEPSDEELAAIEAGDESAGAFTPEEVDPEEVVQAVAKRAKLTPEQLKTVDLHDKSLRHGPDALTIGEIIDAIAAQLGVSRSAVTNILYDFMKKVGDDQRRRRPSERRAIPTSMDPEKTGTAKAVEQLLYDDFREEMEGYGDMFPELAEDPFPEDIAQLPADYRKELFRNYGRLFFSTNYGENVYSSVDLIANWHTMAELTGNPPREHGNGTPHSENASLHGFIVSDVRELIGNMTSNDFEQYLARANAMVDAGKTVGGKGSKGVLSKLDKQAEKIAKKKAKAKAKSAGKK